ncbi:DUF302 domain-containing protein [Nocardia vaccinii]|uniref:DUF302 domain-containing protein n=1 Tax=Nocardia vaccinii TaxID=1822 RepID=UPI0008361B1D|nr:DUF302 domain-containing protein [Nocardia vaccinii]
MTLSADTARVRRITHSVNRFVIEADDTFDNVCRRFEELVPDIDFTALTEMVNAGDLEAVTRYTAERTPNSFANFWTLDPTAMMKLRGNDTRAVTYMIGNNVIAETMFRHDAGIMLYAPIRVAIYTDGDDRTFLGIDQPSTRFDSFGNPDIAGVGKLLDRKLAVVLGLLGVTVPTELTPSAL